MNRPGHGDFLRVAIALVWLYQGAWMKLIAVDPHHLSIVEAAIPFGPPRLWIGLIGALEIFLALWFLFPWKRRWCAWAQVGLLLVMNLGGLLSAGDQIPDPFGMILMNTVFALAILGAGGAWKEPA